MNTDKPDAVELIPLCGVHQQLEDTQKLEVAIGNGCVACSLHERSQLLAVLGEAPNKSEDSLATMHRVIHDLTTLTAERDALLDLWQDGDERLDRDAADLPQAYKALQAGNKRLIAERDELLREVEATRRLIDSAFDIRITKFEDAILLRQVPGGLWHTYRNEQLADAHQSALDAFAALEGDSK